jgi:glycosyltransferase involved in cell wall biosynthesis
MTTVTIGVHVHAEPDRLATTLRALATPSAHAVHILLLPDGADAATRAALASMTLAQSGTTEPAGVPACFNRLAALSQSDVVILLESGAIPAPGAVDRLVDALAADARNGIAGPSTNEAWNEQRVISSAEARRVDVSHTAAVLARRHGTATRSLAPLHSLSDFCYAVRREVIDAIGGADEGYGLGPCWEMEYSARAVRAGFKDLWVCGAYVYRAPFTTRRRTEEARRFDASRRRYQDSLCALRLRNQRAAYEPHCRGEACQHFAPRALIQITRPLPPRPPMTVPAAEASASEPQAPRPSGLCDSRRLLVSCVMPTRNRAEFALQAVRLFQAQDYEPRELLIVDDGDDDLAERLPADARIRYIRSPRGESIGAKRNRACAQSAGGFIAQWDDDDWYAADRLSAQLRPLTDGRADITGLRTGTLFDLRPWRFWTVSDGLHRRLFREDVHGGTLVFARHVWERLAQYPPASLAEDAAFLARARTRGARLERIAGEGLFIYLRHGGNAWRFRCGDFLDPAAWAVAREPPLPPADRTFYAAHSQGAPPSPERPFVSCIMPTADRRCWVPSAIEYFLRQDYRNSELIVLDDGDDRVADLIPAERRVRYFSLDQRLILGEKRNRACELARGEVIVHWDDDDWQAASRLSYQVESLEAAGAGLCGSSRVLYFEPASRRAWLYHYPERQRKWVAGNSLCYRRSLWMENRFAAVAIGEDTRFVWDPRVGTPLDLPDHRFFAALIHPSNSSRKVTRGAVWQSRPLDELRSLLQADWARYEL